MHAASAIAICALTESTGGPVEAQGVDDRQGHRRRRRRHQHRVQRGVPGVERPPPAPTPSTAATAPTSDGAQHRPGQGRAQRRVADRHVGADDEHHQREADVGQQRERGVGGVDDVESGASDHDSGHELTDDHGIRSRGHRRRAADRPCRRRPAAPGCRTRTRDMSARSGLPRRRAGTGSACSRRSGSWRTRGGSRRRSAAARRSGVAPDQQDRRQLLARSILARSALTRTLVSGSSARRAARRMSLALRNEAASARSAATVCSTASASAIRLR